MKNTSTPVSITIGPVRVIKTEWSIGPAHDPYGATEIKLLHNDGTAATWYSDGLGTNRVKFYSDYQSTAIRVMGWYESGFTLEEKREERQLRLKANMLARHLVGISFDAAEVELNETCFEEDPMGPASMYI